MNIQVVRPSWHPMSSAVVQSVYRPVCCAVMGTDTTHWPSPAPIYLTWSLVSTDTTHWPSPAPIYPTWSQVSTDTTHWPSPAPIYLTWSLVSTDTTHWPSPALIYPTWSQVSTDTTRWPSPALIYPTWSQVSTYVVWLAERYTVILVSVRITCCMCIVVGYLVPHYTYRMEQQMFRILM